MGGGGALGFNRGAPPGGGGIGACALAGADEAAEGLDETAPPRLFHGTARRGRQRPAGVSQRAVAAGVGGLQAGSFLDPCCRRDLVLDERIGPDRSGTTAMA